MREVALLRSVSRIQMRRTPIKKAFRPSSFAKRANFSAMKKRPLLKRTTARQIVSDTEFKFFDTAVSSTISTTGATITSLNLSAQGSGEQNHVGNKITVTAIDFRGFIQWQSSMPLANFDDARVRIMIVLDKQCNSAVAGGAEIWEDNTVFNSFNNLDNTDRFVILRDWVESPTSPIATTTDNWATAANTVIQCPPTGLKFHKRVNIPILFTGSSGAIGTIKSNNIFICAIGNANDAVHTLKGTARIRFVDN